MNATKGTQATKSVKSKPAAKTKKAETTNGDGKNLSAINAPAKVLIESMEPMNCKELIDAMAAKKYWTSPGGKTPAQTLYRVETMLPKSR